MLLTIWGKMALIGVFPLGLIITLGVQPTAAGQWVSIAESD